MLRGKGVLFDLGGGVEREKGDRGGMELVWGCVDKESLVVCLGGEMEFWREGEMSGEEGEGSCVVREEGGLFDGR